MTPKLLRAVAHHLNRKFQPYKDIVLISYLDNRDYLTLQDTILLSYPRSGNTWTRHLIADLVQQSLGFETHTVLPVEFWKVVPSIYSQSLKEVMLEPVWQACRLIKSHEHQDLGGRKAIYVFRNPADVLYSWYRYNCKKKYIDPEKISADKFCLDKLNEWIQHVEAAIAVERLHPGQLMWICYETLHDNPHACLRSIVRFLGLSEPKIDIDRAIRNNEFDSRKRVGNLEEQMYATCQGEIGSSQRALSPGTLKAIQQRAMPVYEKACRLSMPVSAK